MTTLKSRYSPASDLIPGDEFYWKTTDLRGNGLRYYVVTHIVEGIAYAYQEYHPAIVLPIDMTQEVRITGRNRAQRNMEEIRSKINALRKTAMFDSPKSNEEKKHWNAALDAVLACLPNAPVLSPATTERSQHE